MSYKTQEEILREVLKSYQEAHSLEPAMLVTWKKGLQNRKKPDKRGIAVVVKVLDPPCFEESQGVETPYFKEKLDVCLGFLEEEEELLFCYFDSQRFRPCTDKEAGGARAKAILEAYREYNREAEFKDGDLVTWKEGMKYKKHPALHGVGVVMRTLGNPILDPTKESGSPYFRDSLNIQIGTFSPGDKDDTGSSFSKKIGREALKRMGHNPDDPLGQLLMDFAEVVMNESNDDDEEESQEESLLTYYYDSHRFYRYLGQGEEEDRLLEAFRAYWKLTEVEEGDLVVWKEGLKNRKKPEMDQPALVIKKLDMPLLEPCEESGSQYFQEVLDVELGMIDKDGDLVTFYYDSRKFRPYREQNRPLERAYQSYKAEFLLQTGDIVTWKRGMVNRPWLKRNQLAIVVKALKVPLMDPSEESGAMRFQEELDLLLGVIDDDGDFAIHHGNSQRFCSASGGDKKLTRLLNRYKEQNEFHLGDLVIWKRGLRNKRNPVENRPAVVVEIPSPPLFHTTKDSNSPYYHEKFDFRLGVLDEDGDFVSFFYDKNRFELYQGEDSDLKESWGKYCRAYDFQKGDLVVWKEGLKNKKRPKMGQVGMVIKVLDRPVLDREEKPGSSYFRENLDVQIGIVDEDGDFLIYHYDSRRFELYEREEPELDEIWDRYNTDQTLVPGDLVAWKEDLRNRKYPFLRDMAIVVEYCPENSHTSSETEAASPKFGETLDVALGVLTEGDDFMVFWYDSKRLEKLDRS